MARKAQVTVFIILGIILLAIFSLVLFITNSTVSDKAESAQRTVVEDVPSEFIAIQTYTETCLESTATEGLIILGQQGGYLYPTTVGEYSLTDPTNSDGINLDPLVVPYWHYNKEENGLLTVEVASLMPSLDDDGDYMSISAQLGRYIDEEIESCLNGYAAFTEQEYTVSYDNKETSVRIFDGELDFTLDMPLTATRGDAKSDMAIFYTSVDLDLKSYYETAKGIAEDETEFTFLENQLLELIHLHSRLDSDALPPVTSMVITDSDEGISWETPLVAEEIKGILQSYVPVLRYLGSDNFFRYDYGSSNSDSLLTDLYQQVTDNMILYDPDNVEDTTPYIISFSYLDWEPYVNINGGEETIEPTSLFISSPFDILPFYYGFQNYHTSYDVSNPVLVTLEDEAAFDGEGFVFNFALESNVINSAPIVADKTYSAPVGSGTGNSLACADEQKGTESITTMIVDAFTHQPLDLVAVDLVIPGFDHCVVGETNTNGELTEEYPLMYGGNLELSKEGYMDASYTIDTYDFVDYSGLYGYAVAGLDFEVLEMYPLQEVQVDVNIVPVRKCLTPKKCNGKKSSCEEDAATQCFDNGIATDPLFLGESFATVEANGSVSYTNDYYAYEVGGNELDDSMSVYITLSRIADVDGGYIDSPLTTFIVIDPSESSITEEDRTVELAPGLYEVQATLMINGVDVYIPDDERCIYDASGDGDCFNSSGMLIDSYLAGSFTWESESSYFEITGDELYSANTLTFKILGLNLEDIPRTISSLNEHGNEEEINARLMEDFNFALAIENYADSSNIRAILEPEWS